MSHPASLQLKQAYLFYSPTCCTSTLLIQEIDKNKSLARFIKRINIDNFPLSNKKNIPVILFEDKFLTGSDMFKWVLYQEPGVWKRNDYAKAFTEPSERAKKLYAMSRMLSISKL